MGEISFHLIEMRSHALLLALATCLLLVSTAHARRDARIIPGTQRKCAYYSYVPDYGYYCKVPCERVATKLVLPGIEVGDGEYDNTGRHCFLRTSCVLNRLCPSGDDMIARGQADACWTACV